MKYKSYHTSLKIFIQTGLITYSDVRHFMPHSTFSSIINIDSSDCFKLKDAGCIDSEAAHLTISSIKYIYHFFNSIINLKNLIIRALSPTLNISRAIKRASAKFPQFKQRLVNTIRAASRHIHLKKICRSLFIKVHQFHYYERQLKYTCPVKSPASCARVHPSQLSNSEINNIQSVFQNPFYHGWYTNSIYYHNLRSGFFTFALGTFYSYVSKFNLSVISGLSRRKNHIPGLYASRVNQLIHIDITEHVNIDGSVSHIGVAEDNFSRFILSYYVETSVSKFNTVKLIDSALKKMIEFHPGSFSQIDSFISDGGPENRNSLVKDFIQANGIKITFARHDIPHSNNMIEAFHKNFKYRFLYLLKAYSHKSLIPLVEQSILQYNTIRPQGVLEGLIPIEVYTGKIPDKLLWKAQKLEAKVNRIIYNHNLTCSSCSISVNFAPNYSI